MLRQQDKLLLIDDDTTKHIHGIRTGFRVICLVNSVESVKNLREWSTTCFAKPPLMRKEEN